MSEQVKTKESAFDNARIQVEELLSRDDIFDNERRHIDAALVVLDVLCKHRASSRLASRTGAGHE